MTPRPGIRCSDPAVQAALEKDGHAVIRLLSDAQADRLRDDYRQFEAAHNALGLPFATTSHSNDEALISAVDALILEAVAPAIAQHISGHELLFSNFLVKGCRPDSATPPHQDVTLVDETLFTSYSIWLALEDVDAHNGCMHVLTGSHRYHLGIRPNPSYPWRFRNVVGPIESDMIPVPMRKGEALVFSHALIHGSGANLSAHPRVAAVIALYPTEADIYHYQVDGPEAEVVSKYAMDKAAFVSYVKGAPPAQGRLLATLPFDSTALTAQQYRHLRGRQPRSPLARLKKVFFGE